jgi:ABC-type sugar transport system permease subunit
VSIAATSSNRGRRSKWKEQLLPYLFIMPAIGLVTGLLGYAVISGFITSLYRIQVWELGEPFVGLANYRELFTNSAFHNSLIRSFIFAAGSVIGGIALSLTFALVLLKLRFGQNLIRALTLIPYLVSGVAAAIMWRFLFSGNAGLINGLLATLGVDPLSWLGHPDRALLVVTLANIWSISPFATLILLGGLQSINPEYYEAAAIDGALRIHAFWYITIPLLAPMLAVSLIWMSFASFNSFELILAMTNGGPGRATEVLALYMYGLGFRALDYSAASAVMMVLMVINITFSVLYLKVFKV